MPNLIRKSFILAEWYINKVLFLLYINISLVLYLGWFTTLDVFKLKEGSNKKYCSNISSPLKITEEYKGITSKLKFSNPSLFTKGMNLPYSLWVPAKYLCNLVANCIEEPTYLEPVFLWVNI